MKSPGNCTDFSLSKMALIFKGSVDEFQMSVNLTHLPIHNVKEDIVVFLSKKINNLPPDEWIDCV